MSLREQIETLIIEKDELSQRCSHSESLLSLSKVETNSASIRNLPSDVVQIYYKSCKAFRLNVDCNNCAKHCDWYLDLYRNKEVPLNIEESDQNPYNFCKKCHNCIGVLKAHNVSQENHGRSDFYNNNPQSHGRKAKHLWRFITVNLPASIDEILKLDIYMTFINKIINSKPLGKVSHYSCLELTDSGLLHLHSLFDVQNSTKWCKSYIIDFLISSIRSITKLSRNEVANLVKTNPNIYDQKSTPKSDDEVNDIIKSIQDKGRLSEPISHIEKYGIQNVFGLRPIL